MRKKRLMELKPLKVMNRHIADAKKTEISLSTLEKQRGEPGKYRMYCRAAVEKGILKVYLFAVTDIEENINFPRYRLFIIRKERRFITYDEKLSITQRKMKDDIKNSHETISDEYLDEILMQIQRKAQDIEIVLIASKDFNTLFIFFDVFEFLDCVYESQDNLDFSYIYAAHSKGAVYYGADEYDKEITNLFQGIADGLKGTTINSTKDISKIPGINIFENIYIN